MVGFNYPHAVGERIFNRMRLEYPFQQMSNMALPQIHFSDAVPMGPFNQAQLASTEFDFNSIAENADEDSGQNGNFESTYQIQSLQSQPSAIPPFQRQKSAPVVDKNLKIQWSNVNSLQSRSQPKSMLNSTYMDALSGINDGDEELYSAFSEVAVLDSAGEQVTTEDILNLDGEKENEEPLWLDVDVVDIEEIRELWKKYFLGNQNSNSQNDQWRNHTNGRLETTTNDEEIFKKPDPPILSGKNSTINNCQAVVSPMNKGRKISTSTSTSSFLVDGDEDDELDGIIEFEDENSHTDMS